MKLSKFAKLSAKLAAKMATLRRKLMKKSSIFVLFVAGAATMSALTGCSTVERRQDMAFDRCNITLNGAGEGDIFDQAMSADHEGAETQTPTISPTTTANVGTPSSNGGSFLGKVVDAIAGAGGSGGSSGGDCSDGSCSVPTTGCEGGGCSVDE